MKAMADGSRPSAVNRAFPAQRRVVVARASLDPALALRRRLLLPERRLRLEVVHHEAARVERSAAVRAGNADEDDGIGWRELADAMDHADLVDVEPRLRLVDDRGQRLLGHSGVVLERQRADRRVVVDVANRADEHRDRADAPVALAEPGDLDTRVERLLLDAHHGAGQPPVTGGNSATSSPS